MQQILKWLQSPSESDPETVTQEMLVRSHKQKQLFKAWIKDGTHNEVLKNIYTSYTLSKSGISADIPMHVFGQRNSRHVIIHFMDVMGKNQFAFLQDYFRDRIMRIGYNLYLSDRQIINRISHLEVVDRHVLRPYVPAISLQDKPEQLYGIISIVVHTANDRPMFLEISAETSNDIGQAPAFPFDELAEILFI
ncbi:MAG: hypothetical protein WED33_11025 [Bacteroidia bacterium]